VIQKAGMPLSFHLFIIHQHCVSEQGKKQGDLTGLLLIKMLMLHSGLPEQ